jgi:hypothetical protein
MKKLLLIFGILLCFTISYTQQIKTKPLYTSERPKHGQPRWFRHSNNIGYCGHGGMFCIPRKLLTDFELSNLKLNPDETINSFSIQKNNKTITIKSVAKRGYLKSETIEKFSKKAVEPLGNFYSSEVLNSLFEEIGLNAPNQGVYFKPDEQSYTFNYFKLNGKATPIIEVIEKTKIEIGKDNYDLIIITSNSNGSKLIEETQISNVQNVKIGKNFIKLTEDFEPTEMKIITCEGGKMTYYDSPGCEIIPCNRWKEVKGRQTGQACKGNWWHEVARIKEDITFFDDLGLPKKNVSIPFEKK